MAGACLYVNEPLGSTKGRNFFGQLSNCHIVNKHSAVCSKCKAIPVQAWTGPEG
jgi:hypothetical protein